MHSFDWTGCNFSGVNTFTNSLYGGREGEMAVVLEMAPADGSYLMAHADNKYKYKYKYKII